MLKLYKHHFAIDPRYNDVAYLCTKRDMDDINILGFRASFESWGWDELEFETEDEIKAFMLKQYALKVYCFRDAVFSIDENDQIKYFCEIQWE